MFRNMISKGREVEREEEGGSEGDKDGQEVLRW